MPRITIHIGGRERLEPTISKATPLGALGTEAIVHLGPTMITGRATALRPWPTPWSRPRTWPRPTTPTPPPTTSASRPSVTPPSDPVLRRPGQPGRPPGTRARQPPPHREQPARPHQQSEALMHQPTTTPPRTGRPASWSPPWSTPGTPSVPTTPTSPKPCWWSPPAPKASG
jgi:hypothetical protein